MIQWNPESVKPPVNQNDKWDKEHGISQRVIVIVIDSWAGFCGHSFATYFHESGRWVIEGYNGTFTVSHWSELNQSE